MDMSLSLRMTSRLASRAPALLSASKAIPPVSAPSPMIAPSRPPMDDPTAAPAPPPSAPPSTAFPSTARAGAEKAARAKSTSICLRAMLILSYQGEFPSEYVQDGCRIGKCLNWLAMSRLERLPDAALRQKLTKLGSLPVSLAKVMYRQADRCVILPTPGVVLTNTSSYSCIENFD